MIRGVVLHLAFAALLWLFAVPPAHAQEAFGPPADLETLRARATPPAAFVDALGVGNLDDPAAFANPVTMLREAADAAPGFEGGLSGAIRIMILLTALSIAPAVMIMTTCFVRIIVVLGLLKQAMGTQTLPPSQVILGLSLIATVMVMAPTFERVHAEAIVPWREGRITDELEMWDRAKQPLRDFMFDQIEATGNWSGVYMMLNYKGVDTSRPEDLKRSDVDTVSLACAFMLSELKVAFLMGFKVYLPFLIIDMIIASILISMSMMMLPPVLISLPFKILLFVLVDGWQLLMGSLMTSFVQPEEAARLSAMAAGG